MRGTVSWLLCLSAGLGALWQLRESWRDGAASGFRSTLFFLAVLVVLDVLARLRSAFPLKRLAVAWVASGLFWLAVLEFWLQRSTVLTPGFFLLLAAASLQATVFFAMMRAAGERSRGKRAGLGFCAALSTIALLLSGVEAVHRRLFPLRTYELVPEDPGRPRCLVRGRDGRVRATPGFIGSYDHPEFRGIRVAINDYGLRDGLDEATPPAPGEASVLVLGDSYVFGMGVSLEETFQEVLESRSAEIASRQLRVYAGGIPGYGTFLERLLLEDLFPKTSPEVVIVALYEANDFQDNWSSLPRSSTSSVPAGEAPRPDPTSLAPIRVFLRNLGNFGVWSTSSAVVQKHRAPIERALVRLGLIDPVVHSNLFLNECLRVPPPEFLEPLREALLAELGKIREGCLERSADLVVLVIPAAIQADPPRFEEFLRLHAEQERSVLSRTAFHERLVADLEREGFLVVDTLGRLEAEERAGRDGYHAEGHWNAHGNRVAAELLIPVLRELLSGG